MSGREKFLLYAKRTSGKVIYSWWLTGNVYFAISIQPSYKLTCVSLLPLSMQNELNAEVFWGYFTFYIFLWFWHLGCSTHPEASCRVGPSTGCTFSSFFSLSSILAHLIMWEAAPLPHGECRQRRAQLCLWALPQAKRVGPTLGRAMGNTSSLWRAFWKVVLSRHLLLLNLFILRTTLLELVKVSNTQSPPLAAPARGANAVPSEHRPAWPLVLQRPSLWKPEPFISC